jgi:hypothetical protein
MIVLKLLPIYENGRNLEHTFLILALYGCEWLALLWQRFNHGKEQPVGLYAVQ